MSHQSSKNKINSKWLMTQFQAKSTTVFGSFLTYPLVPGGWIITILRLLWSDAVTSGGHRAAGGGAFGTEWEPNPPTIC